MSELSLSGTLTVGEIKLHNKRGTNVVWKINKFQQREGTIRSQRFSTFSCAGSAKWRMQMKTCFIKEEKEYVGLFLELAVKPQSNEYLVNCNISIFVESNPEMKVEPKLRRFENYKFAKTGKNFGYPCFALRKDVLDTYVINGKLCVRIEMEVFQSQEACIVNDDFASVLEQQKYGDFTLRCEGKELKVYQGLLAVRSPVFAKMFEADMMEKKNNEAEIKDVDFDSLFRSVQFIYTLVVPEGSSAKKLLPVADRFQIEALRQHCVTQLLADVRVQDACEVLILADHYSLKELKQRCMELILRHPGSVPKTDGWEMLNDYPELLKDTLLAVSSLKTTDVELR